MPEVKGTKEPMTMTHGRKDKGAIPEANRKVRRTEKTRGGKAFAVEERQLQMELFSKPAEAKHSVPNTKAKARGERDTTRISIPQPQVPMFANTTKGQLSAEMESICGRLDSALAHVVSNQGAAGPNRQTVAELKANWASIKPQLIKELQGGVYHPGDIRRVWIPKAGGGERGLGIPNVIDRVVQEAVREVLEPRYEQKFHASSHGFRPKRSCHTAIAQAKGYLKDGYNIVVDIDLKDFFNRVHHQRLLATLRRDVKDARVLTLIHKMLKAKVVMPEGVRVNNEEGVPQGGPLSPLLSNIVLDELDKELSRRGLRFVRYADDCNIYVKCIRSGERVMAGITRFIEKRLRLSVNDAKSAVAKPKERHFLGFSLNRKGDGEVEVNLSQRSKQRLYQRVKELTPRNRGASINSVISEINVYLKGWSGFFGICTECVERTLKGVDAHTRRRLRAMKLKQKKRKRFILGYLVKMGAKKERAGKQIYKGRKSLWQLSHTPVVELILNNAYWAKQGLLSSAKLWKMRSEKIKATASEQMTICWD
jgi:RNA-directed DNA polymerase